MPHHNPATLLAEVLVTAIGLSEIHPDPVVRKAGFAIAVLVPELVLRLLEAPDARALLDEATDQANGPLGEMGLKLVDRAKYEAEAAAAAEALLAKFRKGAG